MTRSWRHLGAGAFAVTLAALSIGLGAARAAAPPRPAEDLMARVQDRETFERALEIERPAFEPPAGVTGLTVPHHLLAADLIARGFWAASGGDYERVILIAPDHRHAIAGRFGTTRADFDTVFGTVVNDGPATERLLARSDRFVALADVAHEHGFHAVAPFIRHFWPGARIVPVLAPVDARPADWAAVARDLLELVEPGTLIVQSTDFSHYLPRSTAIRRDQESLSVIAARDPDLVPALRQSDHMDSKAAQYLQMTAQNALGAQPVVVANRSSAEYGGREDSTTSYIVTVYVSDPAAGARLRYADQSVVFFGGDALLGRNFTRSLLHPGAVNAIVDASRGVTGGAPLIVNLEGALLDETPAGLPEGSHLMLSELALPVLARLGVRAVSLANNHSDDLGSVGRAETETILGRNGIVAMRHGAVSDLGDVRVLPLGFVPNDVASNPFIPDPERLEWVCRTPAEPPLIVFAHWGREYDNAPGAGEREAARRLAACGVTLIVGAHSHLASQRIEPVAAGAAQMALSLGNYLFDQTSARSDGALLEVRVFGQDTVFSRLIPLPNFYELASRVRARPDDRGPTGASSPGTPTPRPQPGLD